MLLGTLMNPLMLPFDGEKCGANSRRSNAKNVVFVRRRKASSTESSDTDKNNATARKSKTYDMFYVVVSCIVCSSYSCQKISKSR